MNGEDGKFVHPSPVASSDGKGDTVFDDEIEAVAKKATRKTTAKAPAKATKTPAKTKTTTKKTTAKKSTGKKTATVEPTPDPAAEIQAQVAALTDSKSVQAILESKDMLTAAKELAVAAEETFISLGGVLSHIYDTGAHKTLGFDGKRGFADYMLQELNIQYRKG